MTMTRQELIDDINDARFNAVHYGREAIVMLHDPAFAANSAKMAMHHANRALDHLAALEQQAITDYLADVPLPEGWTEDQDSSWGDQCYRYLDAEGNERVAAFKSGTCIWMKPAHWPAIPQAVLVRAAVQCGKLREGR